MTIEQSPAEAFLARCEARGAFYALKNDDVVWRLGCVLLASWDNQLALVRKAMRPGYEFGGLWSLPGGMVRCTESSNVARDIQLSLSLRSKQECGLQKVTATAMIGLGPVVTSYHVNGVPCWTLIVAFETALAVGVPLKAEDQSVSDARWTSAADLPPMAPANQLIVAHALWPRLAARDRDQLRPRVEEAYEACGRAALEAKVAAPAPPWSSATRLGDWSQSWPC